jgi:hypothetical protein
MKHFVLCTSLVLGLLASCGLANAHALGSVDHYVMVPDINGVGCEEAAAVLEHRGFEIYGKVWCGGNYHRFNVKRRGFTYIVHVMSEQGAVMVRNRSR